MAPRAGILLVVAGIVMVLRAPGAPSAAAGGAAGGAPPVPADAVSEARKVEEALNGLKGFVASFTQTVDSPGLPRPQIEKGTVYLLRPGRMRWEYDVPRGKLAVADGRATYVYLPEERQVLVAPLDREGTRTGISFLLGRTDLIGSFSITWGRGPEGGARPLMLTPRTPKPEYQYLLVTTGPDHLVRGLTVVDPLGSRVSYRFDHVRLVDALDDDLFRFEAPEGVETENIAPP